MKPAKIQPLAHSAVGRLSPSGLAAVVALHGVALWALLHMNVVQLPAPPAVLTVAWLNPPNEASSQVAPVRPMPHPMEKRPARPRPVAAPVPLAVSAEVPAPATPDALPAPIVAPPASAVTPMPSPAPAPMAPRFDAAYLENPKPVYPSLSRRLGEEGKVVLRVRVGSDGLPLEVVIHFGSGSLRLDQAALDTVRRWKFVPARLGDQTIAAAVLVPIVFSLKD